MRLAIEIEREDDGRWIADVPELPGVLVYGGTPEEATALVKTLALRVLAHRLEEGEMSAPELADVSFFMLGPPPDGRG